nr:hypothetical protein [Tanacetum cinerariifolium]
MSSNQVLKILLKTLTMREIVSLKKSNKNVVGQRMLSVKVVLYCNREILVEGEEGALHLGPKRPRVYSDLSPKEKDWYNADIQETNILL